MEHQSTHSRAVLETHRYQIRGIVQGVGFRPFVFRVAERHALGGWIRNDSDGVVIEVQGRPPTLEQFIVEVRTQAPAMARIDAVALVERRYDTEQVERFEIQVSERSAQAHTLISPDTAVCEDCRRELLDPTDRRYRYPFINCTNCGPRYSIIRGVPYDRAMTTMAPFAMCERCEQEYHDVSDRRFHAQPTACWECGPLMALVRPGAEPPHGSAGAGPVAGRDDQTAGDPRASDGRPAGDPRAASGWEDPVEQTIGLLRAGAIVAVKGLGGYHLMVDACNEEAVAELRRRKRREEKPFAVMSETLAAVRGYALVSAQEAELLSGIARPIVLLSKRSGGPPVPGPLAPENGAGAALAAGVAPGNRRYGVMLAYTPLHHLLLQGGFEALVATSGNVSDEPIAFRDEDALERLAGIADAFLVGDREIFTRVDDSIVRATCGQVSPIRRARGHTPEPVRAPFAPPPLLAVGPELKNTICLSRGEELFLSHHIGDLKNEATMRSFEHAVEHMSMLLEVAPQAIAHDMHPGYLSTRFALAQEQLPTMAVQHHHAHLAACMCEHGLTEPVVGVVFDGTGYGTDGNVWGGEFLVGDYGGFERAAHLRYFRLPGGDRAVEEPYRVALSLLRDAHGGSFEEVDLPVVAARSPEQRRVFERMLQTGVGSPLTSSMGRLFDGVAALLGVREHSRYEAQAAIELEQLVEPGSVGRALPWELCGEERWPWLIDPAPMVRELAREMRHRSTTAAELSLRFHCTVIDMVRDTCLAIAECSGLERVVLSGGVFQNELLLRGCHEALRAAGFAVHTHRVVPANDGGVALGQAAVAGWALR
jgi:hydrogenase maturation protein HypF